MLKTPKKSAEQKQVLLGLKAPQKSINPKYFYDQEGSHLFEQITQLEEYYPTRTEIQIFRQYAKQITARVQGGALLIEPGAGSCEKVRHLLKELHLTAYLPQDISEDFLLAATAKLKEEFPGLHIHPLISDFAHPLQVPDHLAQHSKCVFYPGSTLGNFNTDDAIAFLSQMSRLVGQNGGLILGADLHKDTARLEAAYNDRDGLTARFNLNILKNINRLLGCTIDPGQFNHQAHYNTEKRRIEMHLISSCEQRYDILGEEIHFQAGESIHTENSYKYTLQDLESIAAQAGFELIESWLDEERLFSVSYLRSTSEQ